MSDVAIALFTRDLRVHDNPMLTAANRHDTIVPLFVLDDGCHDFLRPNRARFLVECLDDLRAQLRERGATLVLRQGPVVDEVKAVAEQVGAHQVHIAADVSRYAQRREEELAAGLADDGGELIVHDASITVVPPGAVTPQGNDHFAVFTPYLRRWLDQPIRRPLPAPSTLRMPRIRAGRIPRAGSLCDGDVSPSLVSGGERAGRYRLTAWQADVHGYADRHDLLAADATSRLSPYLHFGCLSPNELVHRVGRESPGADAFVRQVAWRDFHHQVLAARPCSSRRGYRDRGDTWRHSPEDLATWKEGRTGFPIVDAGMRQLRAEGWMHNRARLIAASFLTKTLYLDWRWGAEHFLDWLVDGDIANNQLNWQWVAGTGTDTRPNRVLNPLTQARRYDPDGDYVRQYVPELDSIDGPAVHQPWTLDPATRRSLNYPEPMVDLDEARDRFLAARGKR